jgi:myo-inositol-1(or 4)-monophosphatase
MAGPPDPEGAGSLDRGELEALRRIAEEAAGVGAGILGSRFAAPHAPVGEQKGLGDYVTAVDRESEEAIRTFLGEETPDIPVLAEEGGGARGERYWAVDPLDGTTNFLLRMPVVAISVGLVAGGRPVAGAIRGPMLGLAFSAARGQGAWMGEQRMRVSARPTARAVVATGFPFRDRSLWPRYRPAFERIVAGVEDLRRAGAASLDLAWVAAGVFDGFFELHLSEWDVAAGALLVEEAGGVVTDWAGGPGYLGGDILAGSPATHALLVSAGRSAAEAGEAEGETGTARES